MNQSFVCKKSFVLLLIGLVILFALTGCINDGLSLATPPEASVSETLTDGILPFPGAGRVDDVKLLGTDGSVTVYEDAEDGFIGGWWNSPENNLALVRNVFDMERQSRVIEFFDHDTNTTFVLAKEQGSTMWQGAWLNTKQFIIEWSIRYRVDFSVYVLIKNTAGIYRTVYYSPQDENLGFLNWGSGYVHFGLGSKLAVDGKIAAGNPAAGNPAAGTWRTFTRDLAADLTQYLPGEAIQAVYFFKVKGKCPPPLELDPSAEPYTIGYWKNNLIKLLDGRKGTQVASMALLKTYLTRINAFASSVFNAAELPDLQKAYEVLSAHGPEPVVLLKKQLLAAEFNYMNGAYYESPEKTAEKIIFAEELILKYLAANPTVTDADLLAQKDLFDAFNNLDLVILP